VKPETTRPATVCAVVSDGDDRILLQRRRDNGEWALPGGHVEEGETIAEAALREIHEETACTAEIVRLTGVYSNPAGTRITYPDGNVVEPVAVCFECRYVSGEPEATEEASESRWFSPEDAASLVWANHVDRLADALAGREATAWT
jgi:ADP-ribose pyrophosphatase YjhB (NUDIX family)